MHPDRRPFMPGLVRISRAIESDLFVFCVLLVIHGLFTIALGWAMGYDSYAYSRWGDTLLKVRFNYGEYFRSPLVRPLHAVRIGFITLIALTKLLCGDHWQLAMIMTNHVASASAGVLLVRITRFVTPRRIAAWVSLGFYAASVDVIQWNRFVLSDATFLFLSFATFFFAVQAMVTENRPTAKWISAGVLLLIATLYRPAGFVLALPILFSAYCRWQLRRGNGVSFVRTVTVFALLSMMAFAAAAWIVKDPTRWPFTRGSKQIRMLSLRSATGEVVEQHTYRRPPQRFDDYLLLDMDRFSHFFQVTASGFSSRHNAYQLIFFLPLYTCALAAVVWMAIQQRICRRETVVFLGLVEILSFAVFHALTVVDSIWRYRLPVIPHLILLSAFGVAQIKQRLDTRARRGTVSEVN